MNRKPNQAVQDEVNEQSTKNCDERDMNIEISDKMKENNSWNVVKQVQVNDQFYFS